MNNLEVNAKVKTDLTAKRVTVTKNVVASRSLLLIELLPKNLILTLMLLLLETFKMNLKEMLLKKSLKIQLAQVRKINLKLR